jgi:heat-inducible transcriptional repressor
MNDCFAHESPAVAERRRQVLSLVIQEYVRTAQPVGSHTLAGNTRLNVSPATIRNDLAALEAAGLLTHPHTSAGRLPTDAGFRYFVQHLMQDAELPMGERSSIRHELSQVRAEVDQLLHLSTAVLARTSQNAALATAPRAARSRFKHVELVAIHGAKVLLVLVLQDGSVKQHYLDLDEPLEQALLSKTSNELNHRLQGCDASAIRAATPGLDGFARQVALLVVEVMRSFEGQMGGQLYRDGLAQALEAPEFAEGENVRKIVQVFEQRSLLEEIVGELGDSEVHVLIAGDGRLPALRDIGLVIGRYGASDKATGIVGVVGPVRMSYGRSVGAVRLVAGIMSELVDETWGPSDTAQRPPPASDGRDRPSLRP